MSKKRAPALKLKSAELVTSRLMTALLYFFFYAFALLLFFYAANESLMAIVWWLVVAGALASAAAAVWWWKQRRERRLCSRVHSPAFLLSLSLCTLASLLCVALFSENGALWGLFVCAAACFLYFLHIVYPRWIFLLAVLALAFFVLVRCMSISFFGAHWLYRLLFALALVLLGTALLCLVRRLLSDFYRDDAPSPRKKFAKARVPVPRAVFWMLWGLFVLSMVLSIWLKASVSVIALLSPAFFALYLILYSIGVVDER